MTGKQRDRIKREIAKLEKFENNMTTAKIYFLIADSLISVVVISAIVLAAWPKAELTAASLLVIAMAISAVFCSIIQHKAARRIRENRKLLRIDEKEKG